MEVNDAPTYRWSHSGDQYDPGGLQPPTGPEAPPVNLAHTDAVGGDFSSGTIAGRSIDQFVWVVSGTSDLFSGTSLPLTPGFFGPNLGTRVCIGECFAGTILEGDITTLTLVP